MSANASDISGARVEEDRSVPCPECACEVRERDQPEHLRYAHGYVDLAGILMPPSAALTCLWDRVFTTGDTQAHDRLYQLLATAPAPAAERPPYVVALEAELLRRTDALLFTKRTELHRLVRCLRHSEAARAHFWQLLRSADPRARELGRELLLPELSETGALANVSATEARQLLERLCPVEDVWDKIRVCQRLPQFGVPQSAAWECVRQLRGERPVACPECGAAVPQDQVESHLRQAHRIYQFRGVALSLLETIAALLSAVCGPKADHEAWQTLESLARDEYGPQAESFLASGVSQALQVLDRARQGDALNAVAEVIAGSGSGSAIASLLASSAEPVAAQLALTLATLLPQPLSAGLVATLRPLLTQKTAPRELQITAAAALLRTTGREGPAALEVLNALIARRGKARAVDRLNELEGQVGSTPLLTERRAELENRIRMRCPRCRVQLRRPQMAKHLWSEHSLLLDGRRVRQPWRLVEDWIGEYRRQADAELLVRCRALGRHLDPEHGLHRVYRLFLAEGIADAEARRALLAEARQRRASLCPHCFTLMPMPDETMPRPLNQSHGRLSFAGYCVEVSEGALVPLLKIETPGRLVYRGRDPGRWLTRNGATLVLAGLPVAAALAYALFRSGGDGLPLWPVTLSLLAALVAYFAACLYWWVQPKPVDRAVDYAWTRLVPLMYAPVVAWSGDPATTGEESAFLAGLALTSINHGRAQVRREQLIRVRDTAEKAVVAGTIPLAHLTAFERLAVADAVAVGRDPVPLVVDQVGPCFEGKLPLAFAQWLLAEWEGPWWTAGNLSRLRVLLCDRAFEAGWEVSDLVEAGLAAPALEEVLRTADADGLAHLRLLWSLRPRRPWARWNDAITVFEVAQDAENGRAWLGQYPDLLLLDQGNPAVVVCGRGVVFQQTLFTQPPRTVETKTRRDFEGVEYELVLGEHAFQLLGDPAGLVRRLDGWFRFHFSEFLPHVAGVHTWQAPEGSKPAQFQEAVRCPECRRLLRPRVGDLARPVDSIQATALKTSL